MAGKQPLSLPPISEEELKALEIDYDEFRLLVLLTPPYIIGCPDVFERTRSAVVMLDVRMRRHFKVVAKYQTDSQQYEDWAEDPFWADTLNKTKHRCRDDFNCVTVEDDGSLTLSITDLYILSIPGLHPPPSEPSLPHIQHTDLQDRKYLDESIETCSWNGQLCVFKQIILDFMVKRFDRQLAAFGRYMTNPHIVVPSAYVVDEDDDMRGFLFPWAGVTIDTLPTVRWSYFHDLIHGLRDIHAVTWFDPDSGRTVEGSHGDVFCRNILVMDDKARWIDIDSPGYNYMGDSKAFADVLALLSVKAQQDLDRNRMKDVETWLTDGMSFADVVVAIKDWC